MFSFKHTKTNTKHANKRKTLAKTKEEQEKHKNNFETKKLKNL